MRHWFKSYGHFTEGVDLAYLWSFSGGGSAINWATPSSSNGARNLRHLNAAGPVTSLCSLGLDASHVPKKGPVPEAGVGEPTTYLRQE